MLIDPNTRIAGIRDNEEFAHWLLELNFIKVHPGLIIGSSNLGGIGLFFNPEENELRNDIVLARIPKDATFDYMSLLQVLQDLKEKDNCDEALEVTESGIIMSVLKCLQPENETEILTCYFIGFRICYDRRRSGELQTETPLTKFDPYLDVLTHTTVLGFPPQEVYEDEFISKLQKNAERTREEYNELKEILGAHARLTFEEYYQLVGAIKSRVLEIPHGTAYEDDYYTNVTLIPLLDFANHLNSTRSNAYFDIDKATGDVLLKLNHTRMQNRVFEITISYSTTESIQNFIQTYGFIPQSKDYQLLEYRIPPHTSNKHMNEIMKTSDMPYDKIMKWLRILPQFQLVKSSDDVLVNFFSNNLPLVFIDGLQYDQQWRENAYKSFRELNEVEIERDQFEQAVLPMLECQESDYDFINAVGQIGATCNHKYPTQNSILQDLGYDSEDAFQLLVARCTEFIVNVARSVLEAPCPTSTSNTFSQMVTEYYGQQQDFFGALIKKYNKTHDISLPVHLAKDEWETDYRSAPKQIMLND